MSVSRWSWTLAVLAGVWSIGTPGLLRAQDNFLGLPDGAVANRGSLVLVGGGRTPDEVYDEFIRLAGGKSAKVVLIPSAYPYSDQQHIEQRFNGWRQFNVASFNFLDTDSRENAEKPEFAKPLEQATGVWISGGAQGRLASLYGGTKVEAALRHIVERGGVVGGTSAGAAIMSRVMIRAGTSAQAVVDKGFGLLERAVVDQHFTQRRRESRLMGVLEQNPGMIGLGIDEGTAVVVQGSHLKVLGKSQACVFLPTEKDSPMLSRRMEPGEQAELVAIGSPASGARPGIELKMKRPGG